VYQAGDFLPQPDGPNSIAIPVAGTVNAASSANFPRVLRNSTWITPRDWPAQVTLS
jgi:hypothetical protein